MIFTVWGWSKGRFTPGDVVLVNSLLMQLFRPLDGSPPVVGVVGQLQLDVLQSRLKVEYGVPAGFDTKAFLDAAKSHYVKLQQAWDTGNLDELSEFTTNEMFIALTHELRAPVAACSPPAIRCLRLRISCR